MVVAQLGATIVVRIGHDGVYAFAARFGTQGFGQLVGNAVHAAHGRDDPDFIAYAHVAVLAAVALEGQVPVGNVQVCLYRMVGVFQQAGQIGLYVVFVHPVALSAGFAGMPDGVSVFDDVFTFGQILQCEFMTGRDIFVQGNFLSVYIYFSPADSGAMATATLSAGLIFKNFVSMLLGLSVSLSVCSRIRCFPASAGR